MKKSLLIAFFIIVLTGLFSAGTVVASINHAPSFTGGEVQSIALCGNSGVYNIDSVLAIIDSDAGQQEVWGIVMNAAHGSLLANDTVTSTGGAIVPMGLSYMPFTGYSGLDSFTVQVTDGIDTAFTTVYVTVMALPLAGVITGSSDICIGASGTVTDTAAGGTWSVSNTNATISSSGALLGIATGIDSVFYTVSTVCGTAIDTSVITVRTIPSAGVITGIDSLCFGSVDTLADAVSGGVWHSSNLVVASVNSHGDVTGILPGTSQITYIVTNGCGSDTARQTVKVQIPLPSSGSIIAPTTICQFSTTPTILIDIIPGGTWSSSNFLVAAVIGPIVEGITPGTATITYTLNNACGSSTATQEITVLSAAQCAEGVNAVATAVAPGISLYPNPNTGTFTFTFNAADNELVNVSVTNVTGIKIKEFVTMSNKAASINIDLPAGMYFINASTANSRYTEKLMIK